MFFHIEIMIIRKTTKKFPLPYLAVVVRFSGGWLQYKSDGESYLCLWSRNGMKPLAVVNGLADQRKASMFNILLDNIKSKKNKVQILWWPQLLIKHKNNMLRRDIYRQGNSRQCIKGEKNEKRTPKQTVYCHFGFAEHCSMFLDESTIIFLHILKVRLPFVLAW